MEMSRSTLKGKSLPNNFLTDAIRIAIYILNKSPTKAMLNRNSYAHNLQIWTNLMKKVKNCSLLVIVMNLKVIDYSIQIQTSLWYHEMSYVMRLLLGIRKKN